MIIPNPATKNHLLDAALSYAALGWLVVPLHTVIDGKCTCDDLKCKRGGKHPLTLNGLKDGTTDHNIIRRWWTEAPIANVGVVTGAESAIWMLGPDGPEGIAALAKLEQECGQLPPAPRSRSGGGGQHYLFAYPGSGKIKNAANILGLPIDVRGDGGYFVAPPSQHLSGNPYLWEVVPQAVAPPVAPAWLLQRVTESGVIVRNGGDSIKLKVQADDFRDAVGVKAGQRHGEALRLIGAHVARGDDPEIILQLALGWDRRNDPPKNDPDEIKSMIAYCQQEQSIACAVSCGLPSAEDALDQLSLPEPPPWPKLDPTALHGLLGDIVSVIGPQSEADPVALLAQALLALGNVVGRQPHYIVEADKHCANLYCVLVGESSRGRKGVSRGRVLQLFQAVAPDWASRCIAHGLSSGEGLIWAVRDPVTKSEPIKDRGQITGYQPVVSDHGVDDKRLMVIESEFAAALRTMRREANTLSPTIRQAWDSGDLRTLVKNQPALATGAHVSLAGHITLPELLKSLAEVELFNGFANRFLWLLVRRSKLLPDGGGPLDLTALTEQLGKVIQHACHVGVMTRTVAATRLWHEVYSALTAERVGLYGAATARAEAQVLRLSMLYALADQSSSIDVPHLQAALAFWAYCDGSARLIFGSVYPETDGDALAAKLLDVIRAKPGSTRRELHRALNGHVPAKELVAALAKLRNKKLAYCIDKKTGGRTAECWFPGKAAGEQCVQCEQYQSAAPVPLASCAADSTPLPGADGQEVLSL